MIRISGVVIPDDKRLEISLTYIYGIGRKIARDLRIALGVAESCRTRDLTNEHSIMLRELIEKSYKVGGDLKTEVRGNIQRLMSIGCYRGIRHRKGLPVRGQRTH
jgi:small subunit ribosomal protein S13